MIPIIGGRYRVFEFQQHMPLIHQHIPILRQGAAPILIDLVEHLPSHTGQPQARVHAGVVVEQHLAQAMCVVDGHLRTIPIVRIGFQNCTDVLENYFMNTVGSHLLILGTLCAGVIS